MKEISRTKRFEVAHYYLLGYTYREAVQDKRYNFYQELQIFH